MQRYAKLLCAESTVTKPRSTLTAKSAYKMLPFIQKAIETGETVAIPVTVTRRARQQTLYQKVCDAFVWFLRYDPLVSEDLKSSIALLRSRCSIDRSNPAYVKIVPVQFDSPKQVSGPNIVSAASQRIDEVRQATSLAWKNEFSQWTTESTQGSVFNRTGLLLTPEDKEWVTSLCAELEWDVTVTDTSVTVVRN